MNDIREASLETDSTGLPGGTFGQLLPFLILAAGGLWLFAHWSEVPARVPMHWDARGNVNHYVSRSPLQVAMPLFLGASVCAFVHFLARAIRGSSPRGAARKPSLQFMLGAELVIAAVCCAVVAASATNGRLLLPAMIFIFFLIVALLGTAIGLFAGVRKQEPLRNPSGWHALFYSDPEDPALFVPKRLGYGYTINMGHRAAVPIMLALLALPLAAGIAAALMR
jgi:uncharacterized membrane protein